MSESNEDLARVAAFSVLAEKTRAQCDGDAVEAARRLGGAIVFLLASQHDDAMRTIGEALVAASLPVGGADA